MPELHQNTISWSCHPNHPDSGAAAAAPAKPPCAVHEWADSNIDSILKNCTVCRWAEPVQQSTGDNFLFSFSF